MRRGFTPLAILALLLVVASRASADETHASGAHPAPTQSRPDGAPHDLTIKISIAHRPSFPRPPFDDRLAARRCVERARWR